MGMEEGEDSKMYRTFSIVEKKNSEPRERVTCIFMRSIEYQIDRSRKESPYDITLRDTE